MGYVMPPQAAKSSCSPDKEGDKGGIGWTANLHRRPNGRGNEYRLASSTACARPECEDGSLSARGSPALRWRSVPVTLSRAVALLCRRAKPFLPCLSSVRSPLMSTDVLESGVECGDSTPGPTPDSTPDSRPVRHILPHLRDGAGGESGLCASSRTPTISSRTEK